MKPKGWRLDPAWVEYYAKVEQDRFERKIKNLHTQWQLEWSQRELEASIRRMKEPLPVKLVYEPEPAWKRWFYS